MSILNAAEGDFSTEIQSAINGIQSLSANRNKVIGIEYIYAAGTEQKLESRWGHALLRFVDSDNNPFNDYVLSFAAKVKPENISNLKALTGEYDILPQLSSLGHFWEQYTGMEGRVLERTVIPSTESQRLSLIATLKEWTQEHSLFGKYTFLNNNCAGAFQDFLRDGGIKNFRMGGPNPGDLDSWLRQGFISTLPKLKMLDPGVIIHKAFQALRLSPLDFASGRNWPEDSFARLNSALSKSELAFLYINHRFIPGFLGKKIRSSISLKDSANVAKMYKHVSLPTELYQVCANSACAKNYWKQTIKFFGKTQSYEAAQALQTRLRLNERVLKRETLNALTQIKRELTSDFKSQNPQYENYINIVKNSPSPGN